MLIVFVCEDRLNWNFGWPGKGPHGEERAPFQERRARRGSAQKKHSMRILYQIVCVVKKCMTKTVWLMHRFLIYGHCFKHTELFVLGKCFGSPLAGSDGTSHTMSNLWDCCAIIVQSCGMYIFWVCTRKIDRLEVIFDMLGLHWGLGGHVSFVSLHFHTQITCIYLARLVSCTAEENNKLFHVYLFHFLSCLGFGI